MVPDIGNTVGTSVPQRERKGIGGSSSLHPEQAPQHPWPCFSVRAQEAAASACGTRKGVNEGTRPQALLAAGKWPKAWIQCFSLSLESSG